MRLSPTILLALSLSACAVSVGVLPAGPGVFAVSERRAPVLGGGPAAQRAALSEADAFCRQQGRVFVPVTMQAVGDPRSLYGPNGFTTTFSCLAPGQAASHLAGGGPRDAAGMPTE